MPHTIKMFIYLPQSSSAVQMQHLFLFFLKSRLKKKKAMYFLIKLNFMQGEFKLIYKKLEGRGSTEIQWVSARFKNDNTHDKNGSPVLLLVFRGTSTTSGWTFCLRDVRGLITEYGNQTIRCLYCHFTSYINTFTSTGRENMTLIIS